MLSIAQAQVSLHEDHLELLQTDPDFLRKYTAMVLEGEIVENMTLQNQHVRAALKLMEDATTFWKWDWIYQEVQRIHDLHTKYECRIGFGLHLPSEYERSIGCLEALVCDLVKRRALQAYQLLPTRHGFKHLYRNTFLQRSQVIAVSSFRKDHMDTSEHFYTDCLYFCLIGIAESLILNPSSAQDDIRYQLYKPSDLFAILDEYLSSEAKTGNKEHIARLDEILYNSRSNASLAVRAISHALIS